MAKKFVFIVKDQDGLWGSIRASGQGIEKARKSARKSLNDEVINGSLSPLFRLYYNAGNPL